MERKTDTLKPKEYLFSYYYVKTKNVREAAAKAGYIIMPENTGIRILKKPEVKKEIARLLKSNDISFSQIKAGYERMAFGGASDAVRLMYLPEDTEPERLDSMDLFGISEIKRPKSGGMEIKFFDRLKALDKLSELSEEQNRDGAKPFYEALEQSAKRVSDYEDGEHGI